MYNFSGEKQQKSDRRQRALNRQDLSGLTPQQRQFAEQQFRLIYAQQMSKLTAELSHKKRIQQNINTIDEQETKNLKQQYEKLKTKIAVIEERRNRQLEKKTKKYKANDQKWYTKLKEIQNKFKQQNRQAFEKAQKYREESENYWKSKEKKLQDISGTNFQNSRTKRAQESFNRSFVEGENRKKFYQMGYEKRKTVVHESNYQNSSRSKITSKLQIDTQIKIHKDKSNSLQKEREMLMFQKAMEKMDRIDKIERSREKAIKEKPPKISQPTKPKVVDTTHAYVKKDDKKKNHIGSTSFSYKSVSKDPFEKIVKDHLQLKQRLQEQQFNERGQIFQNAMQKNRKDRILKMVKNKVHQMKVNALMKEGSKTNLWN